MAAAQDVKHQQMDLNSPGPSASQISGGGTQVAESHEGVSQLRVEVTVLRAQNVPHIKKRFGLKRRCFVTVANRATIKKTESVQVDGPTVHWNQKLGAFSTQQFSHLILCLYEKRFTRPDVVIGTHEISIPVESQTDVPFSLTNADGRAGQSIQPVTLWLTVVVSPDTTSYLVLPINATNPRPTELPPSEATNPSWAQDSTNTTRSAVTIDSKTLSYPTDRLPNEMSTPMPPPADRRAGMSPAENTLHDADEAITTINLSNTWEGALERIKWVMDTVSSVAENSFQRDNNIRTLLGAMHDAFDFANREDTFKALRRESKQAQILTLMLQHDSQFLADAVADVNMWVSGKRILKNTGSQADKQIEDFRTTLLELHAAFLDEATITTEITALQILDDVGIISADVGIMSTNVGRISSQLDMMTTQLKWVSSQVSDAELDRKIGEIPYGTGSRFTPNKGCLTGTRTAFLDFIINWVNDPASERCLVLFGQAGTGKS
ncbi:hypothetical protein BJY52DRAFT_1422825, partial [Lactarius psammicola]